PGSAPSPAGAAGTNAPLPAGTQAAASREAALAASPRVKIESQHVNGSVSLKGGRIDDLALIKYRETVDPKSPAIVLFSPSSAPHPYYAEFGWVGASGATAKLPDANTVWK